jgi:serine/threonine-protein kinase SRPK3
VLKRLFQALDFLHTECHIAHTDIKEANILLEADKSVLEAFEQEELNEPCPRKELDGRTIYLSRELGTPEEFGAPVLCDFGSAVRLDDGTEHREDIQPNVYRAPEILLDIPWTYSVDIWNVGCMVSANGFDKRLLTNSSLRRSGTPSKGSTYSLAMIQNSRRTAAGPILLR